MIKKLLFFIFFIISCSTSAQEAAVLIKTTLGPFMGWDGSHGGNHSITIGVKRISKGSNTQSTVKIEYDFLYINDDPSEIVCRSSTVGNKDGADCRIGVDERYSIPYNKDTFTTGYFGGCFADSEIMGIHLAQPSDNNKCVSELIALKNGWNWKYSYDAVNWIDFSAAYQEKRNISFKINELENYTAKTKVYFKTGYGTQFTDFVTYNIIVCSPSLDGKPVATDTKCKNEASGNVTLKFMRDLETGEKFLFTIYYNKATPEFIKSIFVSRSEISNKTFIWNNLGEGSYIVKYQSQSDTDSNTTIGLSAIVTDSFTISSPTALKFSTHTLQPLCNNDKGAVEISASGGTPPYFYNLDNETEIVGGVTVLKKIQFVSPYTITDLADGNHTVKVIDNNNCIEN